MGSKKTDKHTPNNNWFTYWLSATLQNLCNYS